MNLKNKDIQMNFFKKKLEKYIDINPEDEQIRETNTKLMMIFPNSHILFKLERSHDYKLHCKYIGVYIDNVLMSIQKEEDFNWNMTWINVISKLESMKYNIDNPKLFAGELVLPTKNKN